MALSLGVRIAGLFVTGALAVTVAAACGGGGGGPSAGGGSSDTSVPSGVSDGGQGTGTGGSTPTWRPSGDSGAEGSVGSGSSNGTDGSGSSGGSGSPGGGGGGHLDGPAWLPLGPHSPNTDVAPDPQSVYDGLRQAPSDCETILKSIPAEADWQVLHGLASACAAVQGLGGSWADAASDYAATGGGINTCKDRAAYAVLGGILQFHKQHPTATARLKGSSGGTEACDFEITAVDVGGDGEAKPGETITIELHGTYYNLGEVQNGGTVLIDGKPLDAPCAFVSGSGDREVVSIEVPSLETGQYPKSVSVTVQYGDSATKENAFTLVAPDTGGSPDSGSPSATP
ncbi:MULTISPECIES: hypothetical protein [unclassified Streptomyces]|uniref:hypothetical protein n=1 Tax=unclassified Streptomyces TaxID=2593676 RepID=UPI002E81BEBD|nr:hypothetical protein [Streptomyces sp. NBC_00589]WTI40439.1 hypothetical protein OIC96_38325 [Streptomyces sp. NBC_00775]WUB25877.1 hypothetical protein OHA51_11405 [Streptomyces sp. NBC_00589]